MMIYEFRGAATVSPLDGVAGTANGTSSLVASGTPSELAYTDDVLVTGLVTKKGVDFVNGTETNGFTTRHDFNAGSGGSMTLVGGWYRMHSMADNNMTALSRSPAVGEESSRRSSPPRRRRWAVRRRAEQGSHRQLLSISGVGW